MANTFIDKCIAGEAAPADIDIHINMWGLSNTPMPLSDYLGMSFEEFEDWMLHNVEIEDIIDSRRKSKRRK